MYVFKSDRLHINYFFSLNNPAVKMRNMKLFTFIYTNACVCVYVCVCLCIFMCKANYKKNTYYILFKINIQHNNSSNKAVKIKIKNEKMRDKYSDCSRTAISVVLF